MKKETNLTKAIIARYDFEECGLEEVTEVTLETAFATAPKYTFFNGELMLCGYNLYAVENALEDEGRAKLIETYDTEEEARVVRMDIFFKLESGQELIVV